jgi:hypothetical protein
MTEKHAMAKRQALRIDHQEGEASAELLEMCQKKTENKFDPAGHDSGPYPEVLQVVDKVGVPDGI